MAFPDESSRRREHKVSSDSSQKNRVGYSSDGLLDPAAINFVDGFESFAERSLPIFDSEWPSSDQPGRCVVYSDGCGDFWASPQKVYSRARDGSECCGQVPWMSSVTEALNLTSKLSNLAAPLSPTFTPDELSLIIGTCVPDGVAVIGSSDGRILGANPRLEEILESPLRPGDNAPTVFDTFIHPEDRGVFNMWLSEDFKSRDGSFQVRLKSSSKQDFVSDLYVSSFRWQRQDLLLIFVRPLTDEDGVAKALRDTIDQQKRKTLEAVKSSLLIYQFTEKIKKTPVLTTSLLSTEDESQLFEQAARILTGEGLNYKDVTFLLVEGDDLEIRHSTKPHTRTRFSLGGVHPYTRFVNAENADLSTSDDELLVPLHSRGNMLGLLVVTMHPRERIFFDEFKLVNEWQKDALLTIGDMIALLLDNLRLYREVTRQSITDTLTGVHNRHYFISRLSSEINRCTRGGHPISLIFIDVDEFKSINDNYGHLQGDAILKRLGEIFMENVREYDTVSRYGGDEFVILLPEVPGEQAQQTGMKLLERVRDNVFLDLDEPHQRVSVSISLGVTEMDQELNENFFLKSADNALYQAKDRGRDQVVFNRA